MEKCPFIVTSFTTIVEFDSESRADLREKQYFNTLLVSCFINNFTMYQKFRIMGIPHILEGTHEDRTPKRASCARRRAINAVESHRRLT